jgi:hypothetical protein
MMVFEEKEQSGAVLRLLDALLMSVRMVVDNFHFDWEMLLYLYIKLKLI